MVLLVSKSLKIYMTWPQIRICKTWVYINVGEILNSDWLKSYIYFPYTPTQPISKDVKKQEILWYAVLDVKEVRLLDHERILSCNHTFLQPHKEGRITLRHIKSQTGCLFSVLFPRFKLQSYLLFYKSCLSCQQVII
jgi:hypothetical protein